MVNALDDFCVVFPQVFNLKSGELQNHLSGECWMIHKTAFNNFGGIEESYGSYFEDTDFFMKVIHEGLRIGVAPKTLVTHRSQGTFSKLWTPKELQEKIKKNEQLYESQWGKNYPYLN